MKPITKAIIFIVVALVIIAIITLVTNRKAEAPVNPSPSTPISSRSMTYTLDEVKKHTTATDCWTAVGENVYDLTPFVSKHPGGVENITKICGIDGTAQFTAQHGSTKRAQDALATLQIGILAQ